MNSTKIFPYEKQLIKGLISMYKTKGMLLSANEVEYELMQITGNSNGDHRTAIEEYIIDTYGEEVGEYRGWDF